MFQIDRVLSANIVPISVDEGRKQALMKILSFENNDYILSYESKL